MTDTPAPAPPADSTSNQVPTKTNILAIIALIAAFVFAPAGLICGLISRSQIKQTKEQGAGLALAAILISAVVIVLWLLGTLLAVSIIHHAVAHCHVPEPSTPGIHWTCVGKNTWIGSGG
jgi:hypothetical protein